MIIPQLSDRQLDKLSDILNNLGIAILISVAFPSVLNHVSFLDLSLGLIGAVAPWIFSIIILKDKN
jgi:hypothetical protein